MTMAKVENDAVTKVGLSPELMGYSVKRLKAMGWYPVEGTEKPTDPVDPGYRYEYGAEWSVAEGKVYGVWNVAQRPQPYPSWSWVEGEGWVAPLDYPTDGKDYYWDEDSQAWVEDDMG